MTNGTSWCKFLIKAYKPLPKFPTISITGKWCALNCPYCQGKVLENMPSVKTPGELRSLCRALKRKYGIVGCLITGGFDRTGKLPIKPYVQVLREIKRELDIVISVHAGLVDKEYALMLRRAGVDVVDLNLLEPASVRDLMRLNCDWATIDGTLSALRDYGPPFIAPHILIGAYYGRVRGEKELISRIGGYDPYVLIMLVILGLEGTAFSRIPPPSIHEVTSLFRYARKTLQKAELALGCMRPRGRYSEKLEARLLKEQLAERVVLPSIVKVRYLEFCCSLPKELEEKVLSMPSWQDSL